LKKKEKKKEKKEKKEKRAFWGVFFVFFALGFTPSPLAHIFELQWLIFELLWLLFLGVFCFGLHPITICSCC
jgi:hypothetical protein